MTLPTKACEHCGSPLKVRHKFSGDLVSPHQPASCRDSLRAQLESEKREHAASVDLHSRSGTIIEKACEYCGTELDEDGTEEGSDNGAGPRIAHFATTCRDRAHAALKAWQREYAEVRAQLDAARKERDDLQWRASTAEMALHMIEGPHGNIVAQLAKATSTASRWKANFNEKCRAYSAVYGELSAAKMALAAAGALPGVTAIVTVDSRGEETGAIAEAEQRGRREGLNEALAAMACRTFLTEAERKGMTVAKARIRALLDGPGRETETDRTAK